MTLLESIANMKLRSLTVGLALLIVTLFLFLSGIAWGPNGHRVVGLIAEQNLTDTTRSKVRDLLAGESLAAVSNWADLIRSFDQWSCADPFHYSTIEPNAEYLQQGVPPQGDALGAIAYFFQALRDPAENRTRRANALRFLAHIIGDLHQPLHAGRGCDRGGNDVVVSYMGQQRNLHSVWDSAIYDSLQLGYSEYVDLLVEPSLSEKEKIQSSSPLEWTRESQELLSEVYRCSVGKDRCPCLCGDCSDGYSDFGGCEEQSCRLVPAPITLSWEYKSRAEPIIRRRLQEAGLRLAAVLNWALGDEDPSPSFSLFLQQIGEKPNWDGSFRPCPSE